jgi:diadenosine tetraphosphate (Ap4A) HIT family hydrolase
VVTRQKDYAAPGCVVLPSWEAVKEQFQSEEEVFVLGGEQIYKAAISDCSRIYLTTVKTECEGDAFFPLHEDFGRWKVVETQECLKSEHDDYPSSFQILEKEGRPNLVIGNTRNPEQAEYYRRLRDDGVVCAFCKPDIYKYGIRPIQKDGKHWLVMENMAPYENTKVHLLVISKDHAETLADLDPQAGVELLTFLQELEVEHKVLSGGIAWRFGDPAHNGGSVNHLHIHFIVPDKEAVEYKPVRFKIG